MKNDDPSLAWTRRGAPPQAHLLVAGDFAQRPLAVPLAERRPVEVHPGTLQRWFASLRAEASFDVPNVLHPGPPATFTIALAPVGPKRLTPDHMATTIPILAGVEERRRSLTGVRNFCACVPEFRKSLLQALGDPGLRLQLAADAEAIGLPGSDPTPVVRGLLEIVKVDPGDEVYPLCLLGIRHMLDVWLSAGATTVSTADVEAEKDRLAAALSAQISLVLRHPAFLALETAWHGLDALVQAGLPARIDVVSCTVDELRGDIHAHAPALEAWLRAAAREEAAYTAVLLAFDLESPGDGGALSRITSLAHEEQTPVLTGASSGLAMLSGSPLHVSLSAGAPVRRRYGFDDGDLHVRAFPFEEPPGGPPAARWAAAAEVLARCLAPDPTHWQEASPAVREATAHLTRALAESRRLRTGGLSAATPRPH